MISFRRCCLAVLALVSLCSLELRADENLFGWSKGSETLPAGHFDLYQFGTLRTGKGPSDGSYHAYDAETEIEYGFSDVFQIGFSLEQNYFDSSTFDNDGDKLTDNGYRFGGVSVSGKYRFKSPYLDGYGLALHQAIGFNRYDETAGIIEQHLYFAPTLIFQKNFLDNTLITTASLGCDFGWGKRPAEAYDHELGLESRMGISYRFAPGWFIGLEGRIRSEFPNFDLGFNEHYVIFAGPTLHYGSEKFWATLAWAYQLHGRESEGQEVHNRAFAEQVQNEIRLKVGFNF